MIGAIVLSATAGDVLIASAMRGVGDLDQIRAARGFRGAVWAVVSETLFPAGAACMALSFPRPPIPCGAAKYTSRQAKSCG